MEQMSNIKSSNIGLIYNVQNSSDNGISSGHSVIVKTEDGTGYAQLWSVNDDVETGIKLMLQFKLNQILFMNNQYNDSNIKTSRLRIDCSTLKSDHKIIFFSFFTNKGVR